MAIVNGYLTLVEFKAELNIGNSNQDARIERVIEAASRQVDSMTGRFFYETAEETRYYDIDDTGIAYIDDLITVTSLATDDGNYTYGTSWLSTDYDLLPYNAASLSQPYSSIGVAVNGRYTFPRGRRSLRVVGTFGWDTPPADVKEATFLLANRLLRRKDAPFGVVGSQDFGQMQTITNVDPDAMQLLQPYRKLFVGVI